MQSVFGIGLLIFGTPTLLLLGYTFIETLNIILLPSISISFLQIVNSRNEVDDSLRKYKRLFIIYCIPFLLMGLFFIKFNYQLIDFKFYIGLILIIITLIRVGSSENKFISNFLLSYLKISYIFIGILHGITNMGGSFLSILASSIYSESKQKTRYLIAYCYFIMGLIQYIFIQIFFGDNFNPYSIIYMLIPILIFQSFGNKLIDYISNIQYQKIISYIILFYGVLLLINR